MCSHHFLRSYSSRFPSTYGGERNTESTLYLHICLVLFGKSADTRAWHFSPVLTEETESIQASSGLSLGSCNVPPSLYALAAWLTIIHIQTDTHSYTHTQRLNTFHIMTWLWTNVLISCLALSVFSPNLNPSYSVYSCHFFRRTKNRNHQLHPMNNANIKEKKRKYSSFFSNSRHNVSLFPLFALKFRVPQTRSLTRGSAFNPSPLH